MNTDNCPICLHAKDPHVFAMHANRRGQPIFAGLVHCPTPNCACLGTWAARTPDGTLVGGADAQEFLDVAIPIVESINSARLTNLN